MKKILVSGANPAWQKVLQFNEIKPGKVNRVHNALFFASGKGINFARAVKNYAAADSAVVQFLAGDNGRRIVSMLDSENLKHFDIFLKQGETRGCSTCIDLKKNEITELIEPSPELTLQDIAGFRQVILGQMADYDAFAICGTMPSNAPDDIYLDLTMKALEKNKLVLADTIFNLTPILEASNGKVLLKINADELAEYTKINNVPQALAMLDQKYQLACGAITDGPGRAYLLFEHNIYEYELPPLEKIVNAIGCGDTASAVLISEYMISTDAVESFRIALGCASANCLSFKCAEFDTDFAAEYASKIKIRKL